MWLSNSSIGRKVVMSVTGLALVLFLTFHMSMNLVALFSADAYDMICEFLGANWYALVATVGLAALTVIHIVYAIWLTLLNRKARGTERYAVQGKAEEVSWASQNMLVLGSIVVLGIALHLFNFWYNMQYAEIAELTNVTVAGTAVGPTEGAKLIELTFASPVYTVLYLVWLTALWFHLTHGFWSALHTLGWNNKLWLKRWQVVGNAYTTLVILGFAVVVIVFFLKSL
ncbi:MAG: succinate dehydrogenase/fumarate reductase cytochrome b subunit [Bacteroidaceae bacterium]|nr:succinate dehydrogenase/fumarate reductase cytochrome b subunit [Bacteroidaceae bacterium]